MKGKAHAGASYDVDYLTLVCSQTFAHLRLISIISHRIFTLKAFSKSSKTLKNDGIMFNVNFYPQQEPKKLQSFIIIIFLVQKKKKKLGKVHHYGI